MPLRRSLLFVASFFATILMCALITGGGRLLADDASQPDRQGTNEARPAALCPVFLGATSEPSAPARQAEPPAVKERWDAHAAVEAHLSDAGPARDANGNVLQRGRYMQAVYHAFALEDAGG